MRRLSDRLHDAFIGAAVGVGVSLLFVAVGVARFIFAAAFGDVVAPDREALRGIAFYMAGFAIAGALLGLARPLLRSRPAIYAGGILAGAIVMFMIVRSETASIASIDRVDWVFIVGAGAVFGTVVAHQFAKDR